MYTKSGITPKRCIGWRDEEVSGTPVCGRIFAIQLFGRESILTRFYVAPASRTAVIGD